MTKKRYNNYSQYIKDKFGERVQKLSLDMESTCPNRDGTKGVGGCTFCNNKSFNRYSGREWNLEKQIQHAIDKYAIRYKNLTKYIAYFQTYSNTYHPLEDLKIIYNTVLANPKIVGISIGTRSDCVDDEKLNYLAELSKKTDLTIEYGLESIFDESLKKINRGHDYANFKEAIYKTDALGIATCAHLIIGLPWETRQMWIESAKEISKLPIKFLKIHHLHIVKGTQLGSDYLKKPFKVLEMEEYQEILIEFIEHLRPDIVLQRAFGECPKELLIAPHWEQNQGELQRIFLENLEKLDTYQGKLYVPPN